MKKANCINTLHHLMDLYVSICQPVCQDMGLQQTAFVILMFLANNAECDTAKDICRFASIKPSIVSFNVDKLVNEGYIVRENVPGDRRKIRLVCTDKAGPIIERGIKAHQAFYSTLTEGMSDGDKERLLGYLEIIEQNINSYGESAGERNRHPAEKTV